MKNILCTGGANRDRWAVSLCFASATILSLEALHPGACAWLGFSDEQSFALSSTLATLSVFLATFILARMMDVPSAAK